MASRQTFLYFAYGSNLLRERLQLNNPSAVFKTAAKLQGYKLGFATKADPAVSRWHGAAATIHDDPTGHVWGTVWELDMKDLPNLDRQEEMYKAIDVTAESCEGDKFICRTYKMTNHIPIFDNRPSPQYLDVIIRGAKQNGLSTNYIKYLQTIEHNGYSKKVKLYEDIMAMCN